MADHEKRISDTKTMQAKADKKVAAQEDVVRRMNGSAVLNPEELQLLNEMRGNKSSLDFNRAMLEYDEEYKDETPK